MIGVVLVVAAVGVSGSGKTVTLEFLISQLSAEGYRIGAIKHIHREGFTIDREGSNTWRYAKAGSKVIMAVSSEEVDIIRRSKFEPRDLKELIAFLQKEDLDIILIEGFHDLVAKNSEVPKILTAKDQTGLVETYKAAVEPIIAVAGIVAKDSADATFHEKPIVKIPEDGQILVNIIKKLLEKRA